MKRDMELLRKILLDVEANDAMPDPDWPGVDKKVLAHHILLLNEANLLKGALAVSLDSGDVLLEQAGLVRLTWEGHEFLDAARDDAIWKKAMKQSKQAGASLSFAVLAQLLVQLVKEKLGMNQ
jgi:hypothetical protein